MKKYMFILFIAILLSGCATYYTVRTNGYLDTVNTTGRMPGSSSFFVQTNKNVRNPILEAEVKAKIEKLLTQRGYRIDSFEKADFILNFNYNISSGRTITEITPVYNPPETGTIQTISPSGRTSTSIITYPARTSYVPYREIVYTSSFTMDVIEAGSFRNNKQEKAVWIGEAASTGTNPDIRDTINYLLVACFQYFGENTGRSVVTNLAENDPRIKALLQ